MNSSLKSSLTRCLWSQHKPTPPAPSYQSLLWPVAWRHGRQCPFKTKTEGGVDNHTTRSWLVPQCDSSSQWRHQGGDSNNKEVCQGDWWQLESESAALTDGTSLTEVAFFILALTSQSCFKKTWNKHRNEIAPSRPLDDGNKGAVHCATCLSF